MSSTQDSCSFPLQQVTSLQYRVLLMSLRVQMECRVPRPATSPLRKGRGVKLSFRIPGFLLLGVTGSKGCFHFYFVCSLREITQVQAPRLSLVPCLPRPGKREDRTSVRLTNLGTIDFSPSSPLFFIS